MAAILAILGCATSTGTTAPVGGITLTDRTLSRSSSSGADVSVTYSLNSDATVRNHNGTVLETWNSFPGSVGSYEARATLLEGSAPDGGPLNTWVNLSTTRAWGISAGYNASRFSTLFVEIRDAVTPFTVRASATISLSTSSLTGGGGGGNVQF